VINKLIWNDNLQFKHYAN
jgi:26S proteasome non-ATPase regulatory subunit 5